MERVADGDLRRPFSQEACDQRPRRARHLKMDEKVGAHVLNQSHRAGQHAGAAVRDKLKGLWPDAERNRGIRGDASHFGRERRPGDVDTSRFAHHAVEHVDCRRADELGDTAVVGIGVDLARRCHLQQLAVQHHRHPVGERHRLGLIMRDIDEGDAEALVQFLDLGAHLHAQVGVEIRQRLVHQEYGGMAHHRATDSDALTLTSRQLSGLSVEQTIDAERRRRARDFCFDFGVRTGGPRQQPPDQRQPLPCRKAPHPQRQRHVVGDRHMWIERVGLKYHGDVAKLRTQPVDRPVVHRNSPGIRHVQPGQQSEQC